MSWIVMDRMDCLNEINGEVVGLLTTYRCNLNCKYCYVLTKRNKDMASDMAKSILEPFLKKNTGFFDETFKFIAIANSYHPWLVLRAAELLKWVESGEYDRFISEYRAVECTHCGGDVSAKSKICPVCGGNINKLNFF